MTHGLSHIANYHDSHADYLSSVQNKALRLICAAFRTTPIRAMEVEAALPPIRLQLDYLRKRAAYRLNCLPLYSQVLRRLDSGWHDANEPPIPLLIRPTTKPTNLRRLASLTSPHYVRAPSVGLTPWDLRLTDMSPRMNISYEGAPGRKPQAAADHIKLISMMRFSHDRRTIY